MTRSLRLATRGSDLAVKQAATVADALATRRREVETRTVETRGDQVPDALIHELGKTGAFVRSLDEEVLSGDADLTVHSLKDVPTEGLDDLVIAGVPERAPAGDVLVTPEGDDLADLEPGSTIGTASLRRTAQIKAARPDIEVEPIRGNVDTRIEKLLAPGLQREHEARMEARSEERGETGETGGNDHAGDHDEDGDRAGDGDDREFEATVEEWFDSLPELERGAMERDVETEYDGLVLAEAGLARSGLLDAVPTARLERGEFVPAAGQGAIAVVAADPDVVDAVRSAVDHPRTRVETSVERTILEELGGGCIAPIGINAIVQGSYVHTTVRVLSRDGTEEVAETRDLDIEHYGQDAQAFGRDLAERGADELIERARERSEEDDGGREEDD
ncbi:hydroxymethylbilane synthase [Halopenitus sp. POP-27]|uniref:hydroxymethylbilane synthase n=1 Tax=Halopenitus sp. POP-27 TaxID=2994425 RepID=UPI0024691085|nr:hydroxymethylbilane synthase [Halopenitus sp. POP-27]